MRSIATPLAIWVSAGGGSVPELTALLVVIAGMAGIVLDGVSG